VLDETENRIGNGHHQYLCACACCEALGLRQTAVLNSAGFSQEFISFCDNIKTRFIILPPGEIDPTLKVEPICRWICTEEGGKDTDEDSY